MAMLSLAAASCTVVPGQGPLVSEIKGDAGKSAKDQSRQKATVFDILPIDANAAKLVSAYQNRTLNRRFGFGKGGNMAVIGVGDALKVTIFEAGTDGLFSTVDTKQVSFDLIVQPDGMAAIPYVGPVRFAGRTIEQARQTILQALKDKAVQPDVIITTTATASRVVTVSGAVTRSGSVAIGLSGDQLLEAIAKAGGPTAQPYETYVTLVRGNKVARVLYKSVIENPSENVYVSPGDQVFVVRDPRTFTVLGETLRNSRVEFGSNDLNLLEAVALSGGGADARVDAKGYFVFRYEYSDIVAELLGPTRFQELQRKGMKPDILGRYPIVYQIDMKQPDSLFVGQTFPINNRDVIYVARHPTVDLAKFFQVLQGPIGAAASIRAIGE